QFVMPGAMKQVAGEQGPADSESVAEGGLPTPATIHEHPTPWIQLIYATAASPAAGGKGIKSLGCQIPGMQSEILAVKEFLVRWHALGSEVECLTPFLGARHHRHK